MGEISFWIYLILTIILWGILPVFQVIYTKHVSLATILASMFILCVLMVPGFIKWYWSIFKSDLVKLASEKRFVAILVLVGAAITIASTMTYYKALQLGKDRSVIVVVATCIYPMITALLLSYIMNDTITPLMWIGIAFIVTGSTLLAWPKKH